MAIRLRIVDANGRERVVDVEAGDNVSVEPGDTVSLVNDGPDSQVSMARSGETLVINAGDGNISVDGFFEEQSALSTALVFETVEGMRVVTNLGNDVLSDTYALPTSTGLPLPEDVTFAEFSNGQNGGFELRSAFFASEGSSTGESSNSNSAADFESSVDSIEIFAGLSAGSADLSAAVFSAADAQAREGTDLAFVVTRSGNASSSATVGFVVEISAGDAVSGTTPADVQLRSGTISFASGQLTATVLTAAFSDALLAEGTETVTFRLTGAVEGEIEFLRGSAQGSILNNQPPVAGDDAVGVGEDDASTNLTATLRSNDSDPDAGDTFTITSIDTAGTVGGVTLSGGSVFYNPAGAFEALAANITATDTFAYTVTDDGGSTDTATVTVTVTGVNDPAVNTVPGTQAALEGATVLFGTGTGNPISVADVDGTTATVTVTAGNGNLTLAGTAGLAFTVGDGTDDPSMTFTGTLTDINAALDGLAYALTPAFSGPTTLFVSTDDGAGGVDADTVLINVTGVNDAPVNTVPGAQSVAEDTALTFSGATAISVADVDAGAGSLRVTLGVGNGALSLSGTSGLSFVAGDGSADAAMTFTGNLASINAALDGMSYTGNAEFSGADTLTLTTNDQGNTGSGGNLTDTDTVAITVDAVNDAPSQTLPAGQSINEDATLTFNTAGGNRIFITDVDAGTAPLEVTLGVANGTLSLSGTAGLAFSSGDGSADAAMTFTGNLASINAALEGLTYTGDTEFNGADTLSVTTFDLGSTGTGGNLSDAGNVAITVNAVNDAPVNSVPGAQAVDEDTALTFTGANALSVADVDAGTDSLRVTLGVGNGTLTLAGTAGLTFASGDGSGDASMTFTGNAASINTALDGMTFTGSGDFNGADTLSITTFDQGSTGIGGNLSDADAVAITVNAVNDAPTNSVPGAQGAETGVGLTFNAAGSNLVSIADVDVAGDDLQITLSAATGNLTLSGTTGLAFTTGDGTADGNMVFTGTLADINNALDGLFYDGPAGADTITLLSDDQGSTGSGGSMTDSDTIAVTVSARPENTVPGAQVMGEDGTLTFTGATLISVADADIGGGNLTVTLTASNGDTTLSGTTGLGFSAGDGTADAIMTFQGTVASVNAALDGMSFTPAADFTGAASLQISTTDDALLTDTDIVSITVNPINDAPVNTVPGGQSVGEDAPLTFSSGGGNAITIADVDAATSPVQVTLGVGNGTLTLGTTSGLSFTSGDGSADAAMTFTGNLASINAALEGLTYTGDTEFTGADTLTLTSADLGSTGAGGNMTDVDTVAITVSAVNDAPVNSVPGAQSVAEDNALVFSGASALSITDVDAASGALQVTLGVGNGTLSLAGTAGLAFSSGDGSGDAAMTFTGNLASINAALDGLAYTGGADFVGADTLSITTDDQGNTGTGGNMTDADTVALTVSAVNDAPVNSVPGAQSVDEDTALTFTGANAISVADVDAGAGALRVTLGVGNGTLSLSGTSGLSFVAGDGSGDAAMTFTGNATSINAALDGLTYTGNADFAGADTLTLTTNDQGNTGAGGNMTDSDTVAITVDAVNDAPSQTLPSAQSVNEQATLTFSSGGGNAIAIADVDAAAGNLEVRLGVANGTLSLSGTSGLAFSSGDGSADAAMTFTGNLASINAALEGLTYTGDTDFNGADTLSVTTFDLGSTGTGGNLTDAGNIAITVNAVNDAPVNSVPGAQSVDEDTALTFTGANALSVADVDAGTDPLRVTLGVGNGTLTLAGTAGLTFASGDGSGDASMTFTGNAASINTALDGMTFTGSGDFNGADTLSITTFDQGSTGIGGNLSDADAVAITVNAVNDAPTNSVPGAQGAETGVGLTFNAAGSNLVSIADVDVAGDDLQITLSAATGNLTLSGTTGLAFTTGDGTADGNMVFTGTLADINNALDGLFYDGPAGADTITLLSDDQGSTGSGGSMTDSDTIAVSVSARPENTVPGAQSLAEDGTLTFTGATLISVADADIGGGNLTVTLTASNGSMTLAGTTGLGFSAGDGTADAAMTFQGTVASVNAALDGMTFEPSAEFSGAASVQISTSDGALADTDTVAITVNAINDAPVNTVPGGQSVGEEATLTFTGGNAISVADVDAGTAPLRVTLGVGNGTLSLSGTSGLSFVTGDGSADAAMTFTGNAASINTALDGLTYTGNADFDGTDTLTVTTNDQGSTGAGGNMTDVDTVAITVGAVNDAPVNSVPGAQSVAEDNALVFSGASALSITDVDAASGALQVTLGVGNGTLSLAGTAGLAFSSGDGSGDAAMTFTGNLASINAALDGLAYTGGADFVGADTLSITTDDQGNTGTGGNMTDADTVALTVSAVNDAPVNSVPGAQSVDEDTALTFTGANAISVADVDAGAGALRVTLGVGNGTLSLSGTSGLSFVAGDGSGDAAMTFTGNATSINAALDGLTYTGNADFAGADTLTLTTNDQGNTGAGGNMTDSDTVAITVDAVNDAPSQTLPSAQSVNEQATLTFSSGGGNAIAIADVDAAAGNLEVRLGVANGTLSLSGTSGLAFSSGDGSADAAMTFTGNLASINAALEGLTYTGDTDFNGADTLSVTTFDLGSTGTGGNLTDAGNIAITVNAVNDAPVNSVPGAQSVDEDTALTFTGANALSVADVDAGTDPLRVTLGVGNGTLTLAGTAGLTFASGDGSGDASMTFTGNAASINTALDGMTFTGSGDFNGADTLSITTFDQGSTGIGGNLSDADAVAITVNAVNDAPTNSVPGAQGAETGVGLTFNAAGSNLVSIADVDVAGDDLQITLSAATGNLTLSGTTGLAFTTGDGTADGNMVFTGTLADINTALDGLFYDGPAGADTITLLSDDQGSTGSGGSMTDSDTIAVSVSARPENTVPGAQVMGEDGTLTFTGATLISVADADIGGGNLTVTLTASNGSMTLAGTTGLGFSAGDGTADAAMTFQGTVASVNAALDGMTFEPSAEFSGAASVQISTSDGALADTDTVAITVNAVNDAPVNTVPGGQSVGEEATLTFTGGNAISVADVDAGTAPLRVTLGVGNGTLSLSGTSGLSFTSGDGSADAAMTFTGNAASINTALDGLTYTGNADFDGTDTLTVTTNDQGSTGAGGNMTDVDTVAITVGAVNDAPVNSVPGAQSVAEDNALVFSGASALSITDVDAASGALQVTLGVGNGTLSLAGTAGLAFSSGDGSGDAAMTFTGNLASINAALDGLAYTGGADFVGADTLSITTDDQGNTGTGGNMTDADTVALTVSAVNDAPVNSVPGAQSVDEDTALTFTGANAISVADVDAGAGALRVTLGVGNGTLSLSGTSGLSFVAGDGSGDAAMTFTGNATSINAALDGLTYTGNADFAGADTLTLTTNDQGNTGAGGNMTDSDTVAITVDAVNDAPSQTLPSAQSVNEQATLTFSSGGGNAIAIADVDAAAGNLEVRLGVANGTLSLSGTSGLAFSSGDGSADAAMTFTGNLASINAALEGLTYTGDTDFNGADTLSVTTFDLGSTGTGGNLTDAGNIAITVNAVNDAPVNSVPGAQSVDEDTALTFTGANALSVADVDAGTDPLRVTLGVGNGTLTLAGTAGLTFASGDGSGDASMTFTGNAASINTALDGMTFTGSGDFNGADTLSITTFDQGSTGIGGNLSDADAVAITVNAVNDAPTNSVPGAQGAETGVGLTFNAAGSNLVSIADVDVAGDDLQITLSAATGNLTLSGTTGLAFTTGDGTADGNMVFTGTLADINTALDGLFYDGPAGADTITLLTDDQGSTGSGGSMTDSDTIAVSVSARPENTVPGAQSLSEDGTLTFTGATLISVADADIGGGNLTVTLTAIDGNMTLAGTTGLGFSAGNGTDDAAMTFQGTVASVNAALDGMTFEPSAEFSGAASVQISTSDGALADTDTVAITVNAINDAPVNTVPGGQSVGEEATLTFTGGNAISVADVDAGTAPLRVTLGVGNGTLSLSGTSGLSFTSGDGSADAAMTFTGNAASINTALDGLTYTGNADFDGTDTLTVTTNDQGSTGAGGNMTDVDTVAITVGAVNDAPVNSVPGAQSVAEDNALVFSGASALSITDVDAASGALQVTLGVGNGTLSLAGTAGLAFSSGDGSGDAAMTFTGNLASINAALDGLAYTGGADFVGADTLSITTDDQGNTGTGGNMTDADTVALTVSAVNDAPVNSVPGAQSVDEDTALTFTGANAISVADVDAGAGALRVTLGVGNGTLSLSGTSGLSFVAGDGSGDAAMTFTGNATSINAALDGLTYTGNAEFSGTDTLTLTTNDQGNTGAGGNMTDSDTVAITVDAVNDAPSQTLPSAQSVNEQATLTFSSGGGNAIAIADVDAAAGNLEVRLGVANGTLSLSGTSGLAFSSGDGSADAAMTFTGNLASINAALEGLTYTGDTDFNGADTLSVTTFDLGSTGTGGNLTDAGNIAITVNAVNDAPVNSVPGAQSVDEDTALTLTGANALSVADVDAGTDPLRVTLGVGNGTLTLAGTAGLTFASGDGSGDASMTFTGNAASINTALDGMTFTGSGDFNGADTLSITTFDQGSTGIGGNLSDADAVAITVNAVNDAPTNSVPGAQGAETGVGLTFNAAGSNLVSIADVDVAGDDLQITLSAATGNLTLSGTTGLAFTTGDGTADGNMVFTGTLADINTALDGLFYDGPAGADTITLLTDDQGSTGSGGSMTDSDTIAVSVSARPENTVPGAQVMGEDGTLTFTGATLISVADADIGGGNLTVTLTAIDGNMTLAGTTGLGFSAGNGTDDAAMTFQGTVASVNAALDGMTFEPSAEFSGAASVQISTSDGALADTDTVAITVNAINDAPVNTVPGGQSVGEEATLTFTGGNAISVADVDAGTAPLRVTLGVGNGTLSLSGTSGLSFTSGDGSADAAMTFTGNAASINTALDGLTYTGNADFDGTDTLTVTTNDQGSTGAGGNMTDVDTVAITVGAVNDAPVNSVPGAQSVAEDNALVFSGASALSITDVDAASGALQVTLGVGNGTLSLAGTAGLAFSSGDGSGDAAMTFTGNLASINAALDGLAYTGGADFVGADTLSITTDDQGNTGTGGNMTDADTVALTVSAVNDAPVNSVPGAQSVDEDTALTFTGANAISVADVDAGAGALRVTLGVGNGTLSLSGTSGLSFVAGDGSGDAAMTFTGNATSINAALDGLTYTGNAEFSGTDTLTLTTNDQGNTGAGGNMTDSDTVAITVDAVNDAPINSVPGTQGAETGVGLTFDAGNSNLISITDADIGGNPLLLTLTASSGNLTLSGTTGLTFSSGDGTADATMAFTGSLSDVNSALDGLMYMGGSGSHTITVASNDQGATGSGGNGTDSDVINVNVSAPPVNTVPGSQGVAEDLPLTFSSGAGNLISVTDPDIGAGNLTITLTATNGNVTLNGTSGLGFSTGDGTSDATMTFTGTQTNVNTALDGMTFTGAPDFSGAGLLQIASSDGALADMDTVAVTVTAVNDAPVNSIPGSQSVGSGVDLVFNATNSNLVSVSDVDAGSGNLAITLTASAGVLSLSGTAGLAFTTGDGSTDGNMAFTGNLASINSALDGLIYNSTTTGAQSISLSTDDQGNTGSGGSLTAAGNISVDVSGVVTPPSVTEILVANLDGTASGNTAGIKINGTFGGDKTGQGVSAAGDIDGDGYLDFNIGSPGFNQTTEAGASFTFLGTTTAALNTLNDDAGANVGFDLNSADGTQAIGVVGTTSTSNAGGSVSGGGDVDGDGLADVISATQKVGATGEIALVYGDSATLATNVHGDTYGALGADGALWTVGTLVTDAVPTLDSSGDFNGDGRADILIGQAQFDDGATNASGRAFLVYGDVAGNLTALSSLPSAAASAVTTFTGPTATSNLGRSIANIGDINGDGFDDFAMGAVAGASELGGKTYVVFGAPDATLAGVAATSLDTLNGTAGFLVQSSGFPNRGVGTAVSGIGDFNGDGFDDFAMSIPQSAGAANSVAVVFGRSSFSAAPYSDGLDVRTELSNQSGSTAFATTGFQVGVLGQQLGVSLSGGDVNGDGFSDLVMGDPNAGDAYVLYGTSSIVPLLSTPFSGLGDNSQMVGIGSGGAEFLTGGALIGKGLVVNGSGGFGTDLAVVGDVNGDGFHDMLFGNPGEALSGQTNRGQAFLVYGQNFNDADVLTGSGGSTTNATDDNQGLVAGSAGNTTTGVGITLGSAARSGVSMYGGAGDDTFIINGSERHVDGGGDHILDPAIATSLGDRLGLATGSTMALDFTAISGGVRESLNYTGIETVDTRNSAVNVVTFDPRDVLDLAPVTHDIFVRGDTGGTTDIVNGSGWSLDASGVSKAGVLFDRYVDSSGDTIARLFVEDGLTTGL